MHADHGPAPRHQSSNWTRRVFMASGFAAGSALVLPVGRARAAIGVSETSFPYQDRRTVQAVVGVAHRSLDGVKELVEKQPELAKAAWDWGFGDWETALGAASHVGRISIVEYLISKGARPDLFTHAVLGNVDAVRAIVRASPGIQSSLGPHGFTLMFHATLGVRREQKGASAVVEYLEEVGGADPDPGTIDLDDAVTQSLVGTYEFAPGQTFEMRVGRFGLSIQRGDEPERALRHLGNLAFYPIGARSVRIVFERVDDETRATVLDPGPIVRGVKRG